MKNMFNDCSVLATIYASDYWSTAAVTSSEKMFTNCTKLTGDIAYNSSYVDKTYATTTGGYLTYKAAPAAASVASLSLDYDESTGTITGFNQTN